ncbi:MAG: D-mannose binding lectin [Conexibacter sp.]|nr:D-mannose binding lectin [Conexibacter sp.]
MIHPTCLTSKHGQVLDVWGLRGMPGAARIPRMLVSMRSVHRLLIGALAVMGVLVLAGSAGAANPAWQAASDVTGGTQLNGVSCASATLCLGVGASVAVEDGGPRLTASPDPSATAYTAVSCVSGTRLCMVIDNAGHAFTYNAGTFGSPSDVNGSPTLQSVSCPTSAFCVVTDGDNKVYTYDSGSWSAALALTQPSGFSHVTQVACATTTSCVEIAFGSAGERYATWNGSSWAGHATPFGSTVNAVVSLSCTSSAFCLATDGGGNATRYDGNSWASTQSISSQALRSSCSGTTCRAIDQSDNVFTTTDGVNWTAPVNIHAITRLGAPSAIACPSSTLCVAGDTVGRASTLAAPLTPGAAPSLAGTPILGQALTATPADVPNTQAWRTRDWVRCSQPADGCTAIAGVTGTSYTLSAVDVGTYVAARETIGIGLTQQGPLSTNALGPVSDGSTAGTPGGAGGSGAGGSGAGGSGVAPSVPAATPASTPTAAATSKAPKLDGSVSTSADGTVTLTLSCPSGARCVGRITITAIRKTVGSTRYTIADGKKTKVKVKLNAGGRKLLKHKHNKLAVSVKLTPAGGHATSHHLTLKVKR